jgi:hypothetical protein
MYTYCCNHDAINCHVILSKMGYVNGKKQWMGLHKMKFWDGIRVSVKCNLKVISLAFINMNLGIIKWFTHSNTFDKGTCKGIWHFAHPSVNGECTGITRQTLHFTIVIIIFLLFSYAQIINNPCDQRKCL